MTSRIPDGSSDWDKLQLALETLTTQLGLTGNGSVASDVMDFWTNLPVAQQYGIVLGCITFTCTVGTVLLLLIWGGSFQRMQQQAITGQATLLSPTQERQERPLLLQHLLDAREYMMKLQQHGQQQTTNANNKDAATLTPLTTMLLNVVPPHLNKKQTKQNQQEQKEELETYERLYKVAYRSCQDAPGGAILAGRPEARYEAYARAYAGCGVGLAPASNQNKDDNNNDKDAKLRQPIVQSCYRRSYARLYEATACSSLASDTLYSERFQSHPQDIIGRWVRLQALQLDAHLQDLFEATSGAPTVSTKAFNPQELWAFLPQGPFATSTELAQSFVFGHDDNHQNNNNKAYFAILHNVTNQLVGWIGLSHNDPANLSIQLEAPIVAPKWHNTKYDLEACFLLLDRCLYGYGYRRVQLSLDQHDATQRKLVAMRCGFVLEGILHRHLLIKESSRDSTIYALLNKDWNATNGPRTMLMTRLYGKATVLADQRNEAREAEREAQDLILQINQTKPKKTTTTKKQ